jgi:hypothetical protein
MRKSIVVSLAGVVGRVSQISTVRSAAADEEGNLAPRAFQLDVSSDEKTDARAMGVSGGPATRARAEESANFSRRAPGSGHLSAAVAA